MSLYDSLVGHWTFDDRETANGTAYDRTPHDRHGTLAGGVTTGVAGQVGEAYSFDGTDDYVDIGVHRPDLTGEGAAPISVSLWVNRQGTADENHPRIIATDVSEYYGITVPDSGTGVLTWYTSHADGTQWNTIDAPSLSTGTWYHIVCVYVPGSGEKELWVDGTLEASTTITDGPEIGYQDIDRPLAIGSNVESSVRGSHVWPGYIDDLRIYRRRLSAAEIQHLYNMRDAQSQRAGSLRRQLGGHWTFDDQHTDNGLARDLTPNGNHGTLKNGVTTGVDGKIGEAYSFDATDDIVEIPHDETISTADELTLCAWIYPTGDPTDSRGTILTKNGAYYLQHYSDDTIAVFTYYDDGGSKGNSSYDYSNGTVTRNAWNFVAFTEAGGTRRIYIDGELDTEHSAEASIWENANSLKIGAQVASNRRFNGRIDEARMYSRALSAAEIKRLYNRRSTGVNP